MNRPCLMYGQQQDLYNALTQQPDGKRNVRRTKTTWRMVETERDKLGINSWAKSKTETSGGSASGLYVPPVVKWIGEEVRCNQ